MKPRTAVLAALTLLAASIGVSTLADSPGDVPAILGAVGAVVATALFGLTLMAWRWRSRVESYTRTIVDSAGFYEELAAFEPVDDAVGLDDAAAV